MLPPPWHLATQNCGPLQTNAYLLWQGQHAVLIDPAIDAHQLLQQMRELQEQGVKLDAIWNTHGHFDHVYDNARWKNEWDVPLYAHPNDAFFLEHLREQALWFGLPAPEIVLPDQTLEENQTLRVAALEVQVIELPGHSPGSVGFLFDDHLISGDVIFEDSYGRTDLPGAATSQLADSLRRVYELPDTTRLLPGHGAATTVERERKFNVAARELIAQFSK